MKMILLMGAEFWNSWTKQTWLNFNIPENAAHEVGMTTGYTLSQSFFVLNTCLAADPAVI